MGYSQTEVSTLDAAGTTPADFIAELIAYFEAAPKRWQIKPSVASVAGEALVVERKTGPQESIALRRVSTTHLAGRIDHTRNITDAGNASAAATASAHASPEARTRTLSGLSSRFFVVECDDAFFVWFQNSAKTFMAEAVHSGIVYDPRNQGSVALGLSGHGIFMGQPFSSNQFTNYPWFNTSAAVLSGCSVIRSLDSGGVAKWGTPKMAELVSTSSSSIAHITADNAYRGVVPIPLQAITGPSQGQYVGNSRWIGAAPFEASLFPAKLPLLNKLDDGIDETWVYYNNASSSTCNVASWEHGVNPT